MIFILLVLCIVEFQLAACCTYGPECRFPCRCETGGCDPVTGACTTGGCAEVLPSGHGYGWKGAGCRIGNIAYIKNTSQLGSWQGYTSDRAVDGNTDSDIAHGSCIHPLTAQPNTAWWMVDLGKKHVIEEIVIFNRDSSQFRTNDFDIRIGMTSTIDDQDLCVFYNDGAKAVLTLTCTEDVTEGRYVSMRRRWRSIYTDYNIINICEFVVIGYEPTECNGNCTGTCNDLTGCDTCRAGFKLPDCINECDSGTWGTNCGSLCGQCRDNKPCDRQNGECGDGCEQWYLEDKCDVHIEIPHLYTSVVKMNIVSSSVISITWQQDENILDKLTNHYFYQIEYGPAGEENRLSSEHISHKSDTETVSFNLTDLIFNTEYEIIVVPYRVQDGTAEAGVSSIAVRNRTQCTEPHMPSLTVTNDEEHWKLDFEVEEKLVSGCDSVKSYNLYIVANDGRTILQNISVLSKSFVIVPYGMSYNGSDVWVEVMNNKGKTKASLKVKLLYTISATVATTTQTTLNEDQINEETRDKTVLIVGSVIGLLGFAALVVAIVLTVRRGKLCTQESANTNTEMTNAYENANTFNNKYDDRNDIAHVSPDYENIKHPKKNETDNVDQVASGNIEYEETEGQQTTNPYETLDVKDRDVTPTVYQTVK